MTYNVFGGTLNLTQSISVFIALSQTPAYTARPQMRD